MSIEKINQGDQLSQSADLVNDNIDKLKMLFPEIVTEGKIDFKVLQQVLGEELEEEEEYYRFTWAGKYQARREAHKPSTGTLRPAKEESLDWDTTENMYIEGDNLEVLKLMQKSYAGKIKMIYIDPPYNTGKDFVYKDNYKDNLKNYQEVTGQIDSEGHKTSTNSDSDGRYHSNWLNMMYPRLRLARNLLKDDGVIYISIDNHEIENLKKLCSEVFGESNFIAEFIWKNGRTSASIYTNEHEYILCYGKNPENLKMIEYSGNDSLISDRAIKKVGFKNPASEIRFKKGIRFEGGDNKFPEIFGDSEKVEITEGELKCKDGKLANDVTIKAGWVMRDMIEKWISGKEVLDTKGQKITEFFFKENGVLQYIKERGTIHPKTIIENISTKRGSNEVLKLFGSKVFDYPKPVELIKFLLQITSKDDLILDFFSGSASSSHGVLQLNAEDGGSRSFIQVQLPETTSFESEAFNAGYKTISEIGKERIRRVIKKIKEENPEKSKKMDLGFKVFKLDSSNIKSWDGNPENLNESLFDAVGNIKPDRSEEDVLYEILLKYGLDLTLPIEEKIIEGKKVFNVGLGSLFICLSDNITAKVAEGIGQWKEACSPEICRVIFKDNGFTDVEKTNSVQILKRYGIKEIKSI
ncbi:site-specific DNA-methyltransferase [Flavobacteriaceae bacterium]|nr:site-specific DNA-methyltransferase [Flavobacteriaceae bacterium]